MASIYKRKNTKNWTVSWIDAQGHRQARSTGTANRRQAEIIARDIINPELEVSGRNKSLPALCDEWLEELAKLGRTPKYVNERKYSVEVTCPPKTSPLLMR